MRKTQTTPDQRVKVRRGSQAGQLIRQGALAQIDPLAAGRGWHQLSDYYTRLAHARGLDESLRVICAPDAGVGRYGFYLASAQRIGLEGKILPQEPEALRRSKPEHAEALAALHGVFENVVAHLRFGAGRRPTMGLETAQAFVALEEIRVEARAVAERPETANFLRASIRYLLLNTLQGPFYRNSLEVATAATLVEGRVLAGVLPASDVENFRRVIEGAMDPDKRSALIQLWQEAIESDRTEQGEAVSQDQIRSKMWDLSARMTELFPRSDVARDDFGPILSELLAEVSRTSLQAAVEAMEHDPAAWMEIDAAINESSLDYDDDEYEEYEETLEGLGSAGHASQAGYAVWKTRKPRDDERQARVQLAKKLEKARFRDRVNVTYQSDEPGGKVGWGEVIRGRAERAMGGMDSAKPWHRIKRRTQEKPMLKMGVLVDLSGSMGSLMAGVSSSLWVAFNAARDVKGEAVAISFGDTAEVLIEPNKPLPLVMRLKAGGGTDHIGIAAEKVTELIDFEKGPRLLFIISDGGWAAAGEHNAVLDDMRREGIKVIMINIKSDGVEQSSDYNVVIKDAKDLATVLGEACERALAEA